QFHDGLPAQRIHRRVGRIDGEPAQMLHIAVETPVLRLGHLRLDHFGSSLFLFPSLEGRETTANAAAYSAATRCLGSAASSSMAKSSTFTARLVASSAARMMPASLSFSTPAATASSMASRS